MIGTAEMSLFQPHEKEPKEEIYTTLSPNSSLKTIQIAQQEESMILK